MGLCKFTDNRQPETESPMSAPFCAIGLAKAIENVRQKVRLDAFTIIKNLNFRLGSRPTKPNSDMPPAWSELERIRQKVGEDLEQSTRIADNDH